MECYGEPHRSDVESGIRHTTKLTLIRSFVCLDLLVNSWVLVVDSGENGLEKCPLPARGEWVDRDDPTRASFVSRTV